MIIGLTGGIGSGKSTVAHFFSELGIPVYDSDKEAKALMNTSKNLRKAIIKLLGAASYNEQGLNRTYISKKVFNDRDMLKGLNQIVHPAVRQHFLNWVSEQDAPYVIQESALIFENKMQDNYHAVIVVLAPEDIRIQRVMNRDGVVKSQVEARIHHQLKDLEKQSLATYHIENTDLDVTKEKVLHIHKSLLSKAKI